MGSFIALLFLVAGLPSPATIESEQDAMLDSIGLMPEIVVTAPRHEYQDEAWGGLMPEVMVTAPRYDAEDANSEVMMAEAELNAPGTNNGPPQTSMQNRDSNQLFSIDINIAIILGVLGTMTVIIGLLLPYFLHKYAKPSQQFCNCENRIK